VVTIFDVLHYVDPERQADVLRRVRAALGPGGRLLMRVGDGAGGRRFGLSRWVDRAVTLARGHAILTLHCRTAQAWADALRALGFEVRIAPTVGGPPFANTLLIAQVPDGANVVSPARSSSAESATEAPSPACGEGANTFAAASPNAETSKPTRSHGVASRQDE
jgi:O-methyltransferase involved in polyketide biosynthesis